MGEGEGEDEGQGTTIFLRRVLPFGVNQQLHLQPAYL
jgi:hypothetical protein